MRGPARLRPKGKGAWRIAILLLVLAAAGSLGATRADADILAVPIAPSFTVQRSIVLSAKQIDLVQTTRVVRVIPFQGKGAVTLPQIVAAIKDPSWIAEPQVGVILLRAALIQSAATVLSVRAPAVTTLRLATGLGVFMGGEKATATFAGVTVTSWNSSAGGPDTTATAGRPFILYQNGSRLQFTEATVQDLGSSLRNGPGVVWRGDAVAGGASDTTFSGDDTGAVVTKSAGVSFTGDTFASSVHQGLVLAGGVAGAVVTGDSFRDNGGDGMLVGPGVTDVKVDSDTFLGNGADGLNLDQVSASTTVTNSSAARDQQAGFRVAGSGVALLEHVTANDDKVGIEMSPAGSNSRVDGASLTADRVGVLVQDSSGATLTGLSVQGATLAGAILNAAGLQLVNTTVRGPALAVEVKSSAQFTNVTVNGGWRAVAIFPGQGLTADELHVTATHVALELGTGATASVRNSTLQAPVPHSGGKVTTVKTTQPSAPVSWTIIIIGLGLLASAVLMELFRHGRERRDPAIVVTADVWNI